MGYYAMAPSEGSEVLSRRLSGELFREAGTLLERLIHLDGNSQLLSPKWYGSLSRPGLPKHEIAKGRNPELDTLKATMIWLCRASNKQITLLDP